MLERAQKAWTKSKLWWIGIVVIQVAAAAFASWCAWARPEHGLVAVALPILGALLPAVTFVARAQATAAYARGEAWRRVFLLSDSLDYEPDASEYAALLIDADASGPNFQRQPQGDYYASKLPPGYPRLQENLAESTFYTTRLARVMARACTAIMIVALALLACAVIGVLAAPLAAVARPDTAAAPWLAQVGPRIASVVSVALTFFVAGQLVELASAYSTLATSTRRVMDRALDARVASPGAVLSLLGGYEGALAAAALPIPDLLARMQSNALNAEWAAIRARMAANSGTAPATPPAES